MKNRIAIKRSCKWCKRDFDLNPRLGLKWAEKSSKGKFCSRVCYGKNKIGKHVSPKTEFKKGNTGYWLGKSRPNLKSTNAHATMFSKGDTAWNKGYKIWEFSKKEYRKLHRWVRKLKGIPLECSLCKSENNLVWANKSQKYLHDVNDWVSLCRSCHIKIDMKFVKDTLWQKLV